MIAVYMTEKASERVISPRNFSKVVNSNVKKLLYYTSECRHTSVFTFGALADLIATCQLLKLLTKRSTSSLT